MCHVKKQILLLVLPGWWCWFLFLWKIQGTCQYCWWGDRLFVYMPEWCSSWMPCQVSNSGCWCWYHKNCNLCQVMEASAEILLSQQMHYQLLLGLITPPHMLLAGIPVLRATLTLEGVWRFTAQMSLVAFYLPKLLIVHRLTIQLWKGTRSCESEDINRHSNSCMCRPK